MASTFGSFFQAFTGGLQGLGQTRVQAFSPAARQAPQKQMSKLFSRALSENSTEAMDWLYYASELSSPAEQRYCVSRALQIDPHSAIVQAEMRRMRGF